MHLRVAIEMLNLMFFMLGVYRGENSYIFNEDQGAYTKVTLHVSHNCVYETAVCGSNNMVHISILMEIEGVSYFFNSQN